MTMHILIPVDSDTVDNAKIVPQLEAKTWALVAFKDGKSQSVIFNDDRTAFDVDWIDFVIFYNKFENHIDFLNEGMMCLVRREENTIEELLSAFSFKELDEIVF